MVEPRRIAAAARSPGGLIAIVGTIADHNAAVFRMG